MQKALLVSLIIFFFSPAILALRVISLSPALTEIVYALKLQKHLVAVSDFSDFPLEAKSLPSVGPYTKPNLEKIVSFKPDIILVPQEGREDVRENFKRLRLPFVVISMKNLSDIGASEEAIATALKEPDRGKRNKKEWERALEEIFSEVVVKKRPRVLAEVQSQPLMVAGKETVLDEVVSKCGGKNEFDFPGYLTISHEQLALHSPDLVLITDHFTSQEEADDAIKFWTSFLPKHRAEIAKLDPDTIVRPGPRLIIGIRKICELINRISK